MLEESPHVSPTTELMQTLNSLSSATNHDYGHTIKGPARSIGGSHSQAGAAAGPSPAPQIEQVDTILLRHSIELSIASYKDDARPHIEHLEGVTFTALEQSATPESTFAGSMIVAESNDGDIPTMYYAFRGTANVRDW